MASKLSAEQELEALRRRVAELEQSERDCRETIAKLRDNEYWLHAIVDRAPIVLYATSLDGQIRFLEGRGLERIGVRAEQLLGRGALERYKNVDGARDHREKVLAGESTESTLTFDHGTFKVWTEPTRDATGAIVGTQGLAVDVSDQMRATQLSKEREEFYHTLAEISPTGIYHTDKNHSCVFANLRAHEIVGLAPGEDSDAVWVERIHPDDREQVVHDWMEAVSNHGKFQGDYRFLHRDGKVVWVHGEAVARVDADGQISGAVGTVTDITALKTAQQQLQTAKERSEVIAATVPGAVAIFHLRNLKYSFVSNGLRLVLGYEPEQLLEGGYPWIASLIDPDDMARVQAESDAAAREDVLLPPDQRGKKVQTFEYRIRHRDGSWRWVQTIGTVFSRDPDGQIAEVLNFTFDITERRQAEEQVREIKDDLERLVDQRTAQYTAANDKLRQEIAQREATEQQLRDRNALLSSVLDSVTDGVIFCDPEGKPILANPAARRILCTIDSSKPLPLSGRAYHTDQVTPIADDELPLARALRGEVVREYEIYLAATSESPDGTWLNINADPLRRDDGKITGAVKVFRDDTQRRKAVDDLKNSLSRFDHMVDGSKVGLWDAKVDGDAPFNLENPIYYSRHMIHLLGYREPEFPPKLGSWLKCVHTDDRDRVVRELTDHLNNRVPYDIEYRCVTRDNRTRYFAARGQAIWDEAGRPVRMCGSFIDVTSRRQTEEALRETELQLRTVLDSTPAIVFMKSMDGRYLFINRSYEELLSLKSDDVRGKSDFELFDERVATEFRRHDREVLAADRALQFEEVAPHHDGLHTYVSVKFPLHDSHGKTYAVCGIATDITGRKVTEEKLRQEQEFLRGLLQAHERDRQLMAYEIHDGLVQDITGSVWQLEGVRRALRFTNPDQQRVFDETLDVLRHAISDARRVLSGLRPPVLDEAGIVVALEYLIAEQTARSSLEVDFTSRVEFKRLQSLLEGSIYRIVQEAVTNMKKHSGATHGSVMLLQQGDVLRLIIRDNGCGFDPSVVPRDRFGLQGITRRASLMGGTATIDSTPGDGTVINVTLPVVPAETT